MSTEHAHAGTADAHGAEEIKKHVKVYLMIFAALAALTVVTVAISYLHLGTATAIAVAMAVATVKGSLVAAYFMHLITEVKLITWVLVLCAAFFVILMLIPSMTTYIDTHGMHLHL